MPDRLLDTNAISAATKADKAMEQYLLRVAGDGSLLTSVIVEGEVRFGISRLRVGKKRKMLAMAMVQVLDRLLNILPVQRETAARYSELKNHLWAQGKPMAENDIWIAATALTEGLILVTNDALFGHINNLTVEDWKGG